MTHLARFGPSPFNVALFHEWLDTRSPEEHWELIEGVAVMNPAPLVGHQRIASISSTISTTRSPATSRNGGPIGRSASSSRTTRPIAPSPRSRWWTPISTRRAEASTGSISSSRCGPKAIASASSASKLDFYKSHPHNRWIVVVEQDRVEATIHERQDDGGWAMRRLSRASDRLTFGEIGEVCALGDLYRHTNLDPAHGRNLT